LIELGAGAAMPSMIAIQKHANNIVITDYPDKDLVDSIVDTIDLNFIKAQQKNVHILGHLWGSDAQPLLDLVKEEKNKNRKFDIVVLSDLIFNHFVHKELLTSCQNLLEEDGTVWVSFTHHKPQWADRDMKFRNGKRRF